MEILRKIDNGLNWLEKIFCFVTLFIVLGAELWLMGTRVFFGRASAGADEIMRYVQIWMCWIGASYALSKGKWPGMDILDTLVDKSRNKQKIMNFARLAEMVVGSGFCIWFMTVWCDYYFNKIVNAPNFSSVLHIHLKWLMGAITVAIPLMMAHQIIKIFTKEWKQEPVEEVTPDAGLVSENEGKEEV